MEEFKVLAQLFTLTGKEKNITLESNFNFYTRNLVDLWLDQRLHWSWRLWRNLHRSNNSGSSKPAVCKFVISKLSREISLVSLRVFSSSWPQSVRSPWWRDWRRPRASARWEPGARRRSRWAPAVSTPRTHSWPPPPCRLQSRLSSDFPSVYFISCVIFILLCIYAYIIFVKL